MTNITAKEIAELRKKTGLPMMECKSALAEANGDEEKAIEILRKKGMQKNEKRANRETKSGVIEAYVHGGRIGVLVEVNSETDFVAKNDDFKNFAHEVALQVAATAPQYLKPEEIPAEIIAKEKEIFAEALKAEGKPENIIEKIIEGKLASYYAEVCLLNQPYFREPKETVQDLLNQIISKTGEKIVISRFARMELSC